jgi:DNA-binding CsgD family transcriptional regulator
VRGSRHIAQQWRDADLIQPDAGITQENPTYLTRVARGKTSAEIAQILGLTKRTVDRQRPHQVWWGNSHASHRQGGD